MKKPPTNTAWKLRRDDLPPERVLTRAGLRDLEENAVFRLLVHHHHRFGMRRKALVAAYLIGWMASGTLYCRYAFLVDLDLSLLYSFGTMIVMGIMLANIYLQAGIEGYETNGNLKPYFKDIIASGLSGREIALGIWGKTITHYNVGLIRAGLVFVLLILAATIFYFDVRASPLLIHLIVLLGVFMTSHLFRVLSYLESITLPGSALWYSGVRRGYEHRLAELEGAGPGPAISIFRLILFLAISLSVVVVPIGGYLMIGMTLGQHFPSTWDDAPRLALLSSIVVLFVATGMLTGTLWGRWTRRSAERMFDRLADQIERLFKLRGHVFGEGG